MRYVLLFFAGLLISCKPSATAFDKDGKLFDFAYETCKCAVTKALNHHLTFFTTADKDHGVDVLNSIKEEAVMECYNSLMHPEVQPSSYDQEGTFD